MARRLSVIIPCLLLAAGMVFAGTQRKFPYVRTYSVNVASISALRGLSGVDARRIISNAASYWSAYGGSSLAAEDIGTTTATSCIFAAGTVIGNTGQSVNGPSINAEAQNCGGGGFRITLFGVSNTIEWFAQPMVVTATSACATGNLGTCADLSGTLRHEFGHLVLVGVGEDAQGHITTPISKDRCLLQNGGGANGLCEKEIDIIGSVSVSQNTLVGP